MPTFLSRFLRAGIQPVIVRFSGRGFASLRLFAVPALLFLASGCSSTTVTLHSAGNDPRLCKETAKSVKAVVYWGTAWRRDQKETGRREAIIEKGVEDFLRTMTCLSVQTISRTIDGRNVLQLSDNEVLAMIPPGIDRIHILRFEELGPVLQFYLSPILWTSDLNIQVRIRTLNVRTGSLESDVTVHWRKGGPFNLRGTGGLPAELAEMLRTVFLGNAAH